MTDYSLKQYPLKIKALMSKLKRKKVLEEVEKRRKKIMAEYLLKLK